MQYDYMLRDKGIYGATGGLHHAGTHACWTFLILIPFVTSADQLLILPLVDFVAHYHIDWVKQQLSRDKLMPHRQFWILFGADQALHYLTYVGIIYYVTLS